MKILSTVFLLNVYLFAEINVITSKGNDFKDIDEKKLSNIYLKKVTTINEKKVNPIDNVENYNEFYKKVVKKTPQQIHSYWMKEIFTGKKRPPKKVSNSKIENELKNDISAIAYNSEKSNDKNTKVIYEVK